MSKTSSAQVTLRLAAAIGATMAALAATPAGAMTATCGGGGVVVITPDIIDATLFGIAATCNGARFDGTARKVDTGTPSDLLVRGIWERTAAKTDGAVTDTLTFSESGYTQPPNGPANAWHELHGFMSLGVEGAVDDLALDRASLSVDGTLNGVFTVGTATGALGHGAGFDRVGPFTRVDSGPLWTRTATYSWTFNEFTEPGDRIVFNATGHNYWVPEPASTALLAAALGGLAWLRRRRSHA